MDNIPILIDQPSPGLVMSYLTACHLLLCDIAGQREKAHTEERTTKTTFDEKVIELNESKLRELETAEMAETAFTAYIKRKTAKERHDYEIAKMDRVNLDKRMDTLKESININKKRLAWLEIEYKAP